MTQNDSVSGHTPESHSSQDKPRQSRSLLTLITGIVAVLLACGLVAAILLLIHNVSYDPIPAGIRNSTPFTLYLPTKLPTGYAIRPASIFSSDGTVQMMVSSQTANKTYSIVQQPIPKGFNPQVMFSHNPLPSAVTSLGTVYNLTSKNQLRYMLVAPNSLVFVSSSAIAPSASATQMIDSLKKAN